MEVVELPAHLAAEAVALWHECGLTRPWNDPVADLERALAGPSSTVLACLAERDDAAAGAAGDRLLATVMVGHDGHRAWLYYLAVREQRRGRGLGRLLVHACEQWALARGVPKLQLMVRTGNEPVLAFYERLGYQRNDVVVLGRRLDT